MQWEVNDVGMDNVQMTTGTIYSSLWRCFRASTLECAQYTWCTCLRNVDIACSSLDWRTDAQRRPKNECTNWYRMNIRKRYTSTIASWNENYSQARTIMHKFFVKKSYSRRRKIQVESMLLTVFSSIKKLIVVHEMQTHADCG